MPLLEKIRSGVDRTLTRRAGARFVPLALSAVLLILVVRLHNLGTLVKDFGTLVKNFGRASEILELTRPKLKICRRGEGELTKLGKSRALMFARAVSCIQHYNIFTLCAIKPPPFQG